MPQTGLRFEQAPPISVPFRFFLSAPVFLALAAATMLWRGTEVLHSRLSSSALAVTHLFALGFMSMVMSGAMMQLLPVVAGAPIARPRAVAGITHAGVSLGALALTAGFLFDEPWLFKAATLALGIGFGVFIAAVAVALWRASVRSPTTGAMGLAALSLLATVVLGLVLASSRGWELAQPHSATRYLHPGWGLLGWLGVLAMGVAYQVVPMFQSTPAYPVAIRRYLAGSVIALLVLWSAASWLGNGAGEALALACTWALVGAYALFAGVTLRLQHRRRRREPDVTFAFWRLGMASLLVASLLWAVRAGVPDRLLDAIDALIGLLTLFGFAGSIINGMLYKITPFIAWLHLQSVTGAGRAVPNMKQILGEADQRRQFSVHVAALALLAAAAMGPAVLVYPAALLLGASAVLLESNLIKVLRSFEAIPQLERSPRRTAIALWHEEKR